MQLERTLDPGNPEEIKQLGRYLLRAPVAESRLDYDRANQVVNLEVPGGDDVVLDAGPAVALAKEGFGLRGGGHPHLLQFEQIAP